MNKAKLHHRIKPKPTQTTTNNPLITRLLTHTSTSTSPTPPPPPHLASSPPPPPRPLPIIASWHHVSEAVRPVRDMRHATCDIGAPRSHQILCCRRPTPTPAGRLHAWPARQANPSRPRPLLVPNAEVLSLF